MSESTKINTETESDAATLDTKFLEKWGFDLKDLYKLALRFYKEKEGKAVHISYQEKCALVAYTQQVSQGPYDPAAHGDVGVLDVIGKDRKIAWQKLGSISREVAMSAFVEKLDTLCPSFHPYVVAQKQDAENRAIKAKEEEEQRRIEEKRRLEEEEEKRRVEAEQEEKRKLIKEALNQQTYTQFKAYAEQQYPDNPDHQGVLIRQLQDQHYVQYMQQIYQQQVLEKTREEAEGSNLPVDVEAAALNALESVPPVQNEEQYSDLSDGEHEEDLIDVAPASMWTRKDIKEFKESIRKEGKESIIKVGHGETVTVRVPTHEDGSCLFWEFATDSYDIGFGLFFEWTKSPTQQVSVHISDSEEDEEDEEDTVEVTEEDIEQGGSLLRNKDADRPPMSVIVPVYRRDCQEEVYAGSHMYPGQGVYLLKFDNSYSLWRSKTLYYRVYYTR